MKSNFRFAGILVLTLAAMSAVFSPGGFKHATAAGNATTSCSIPNNVVCTVSSPFGVKHVTVTLHTSRGDAKVVDESFRCESPVQVSWDPIVPSSSMKVDTCDSLSATNAIAVVQQGSGLKKVVAGPVGPAITRGSLSNGAPTIQKAHWGCGPASAQPFLPCGILQSYCALIGGNYEPTESPTPSPEPEEPSGTCETPVWPPAPEPHGG